MNVALPFPATFADLMQVEGKAELIGGRIVEQMASGRKAHRIGERIARSLEDHAASISKGEGCGDGIGYAMDPPLSSGRQSFSPDASYYAGPYTEDTSFIDGAPTFAVEVRSENDYGRTPDREYAAKRADYFQAGTLVVWDVDPDAKTVTKFTPTGSIVFTPGMVADAEPAVPGWSMAVDSIFRQEHRA